MNASNIDKHMPTRPKRRGEKGISLVIVLVMLVVIGLTSAAAIRNATSTERVTNNVRTQNLAHQHADAALRYCEAQVAKADDDATRVATLKESKIVETAFDAANPAWDMAVTWTGVGGASGSLTSVPEGQISSADSAFKPAELPQCVAEKRLLADRKRAYVITARGFSTDYVAVGATGATQGGSVVWLQSTFVLN